MNFNNKKKIIITGCGIKSLSHVTRENEAAIQQADFVLYLVNEPVIDQWIQKKSNKCESLENIYFSEKLRTNAYKKISNRILHATNEYECVCVVVYGHPLMLSNSISNLIKQVDKSLIDLHILPAISAFDCLLADLEIDPINGCLSIEANELINKNKNIDPTNHLIIWQVGLIQDAYSHEHNTGAHGRLRILKNKLLNTYNPMHKCILYEASIYPHISPSKIEDIILNLDQMPVSRLTTAYIPPIMST